MPNYKPDLSSGYKKYTAILKDLEGMLNVLENIFDISNYKNKINTIKLNAKKAIDSLPSMLFESMQKDCEGFTYEVYIAELSAIQEEINNKYQDYYKLYLLNNTLTDKLKNVNPENIHEIINTTLTLIQTLNEITSRVTKEVETMINTSYELIYQAIKYEELFERNDIFEYIKKYGLRVNIEALSRLIAKDIKDNKINLNSSIFDEFEQVSEVGLGFDYFTQAIIKKISEITLGSLNGEYQEKKRMALDSLKDKIETYNANLATLFKTIKINLSNIRKKQIISLLLTLRLIAVPFLPFGLGFLGYKIGKNASDEIDLYQTTTCTRNLKTNQIIGNKEVIFDEIETTYVATIKECSPWKNNPTGNGYVREVVTYEYVPPKDVTEDFRISDYEIGEDAIKKYTYTELKEELDINDSKTDTIILITETYQDKTITKKSKKYILPLTITGAAVGTIGAFLINMYTLFGFEITKRELEEISYRIKGDKLEGEKLNSELSEFNIQYSTLKKEYEATTNKYDEIKNNFPQPTKPTKPKRLIRIPKKKG